MNATDSQGGYALAFAVCLFILFVGWLSVYMLLPPCPVPASAPPTEFSAERALEFDRAVASAPHPAGSPANERTQQYILDKLKSMGIAAEIHSSRYVRGRSCGQANVVIARIPGTATTKAFAMEAHYDSVPYGPGAADDGAGVAAMLETARALKAGPPLMNDVIFVFSDSEESAALGARAFAEHPWSKDVGVLLAFESRGNRGSSLMFETSPENGWLIAEMSKAGIRPAASSLMYDVYKRLPFNSDFSVFKRAGLKGLNIAFVDNFAHYHTKNDDPDNLSLASLQHHGTYGLGLARHFGNIPLNQVTAPDAMYFNTIGSWMVHYPLAWGAPLAILTALVFVGVLVLGLVKRHLTVRGIIAGCVAFALAALLASATALFFLATAYGPRKFYTLYTTSITHLPDLRALYHNNLYGAAFAAGAVAVMTLFYGHVFRLVRAQNLAAGALVAWLAALAGMTWYLPGGGYLVQWPLLFSSLGLGFLFLAPDPDALPAKRTALLAVFAVPGLVLVTPAFVSFLSTLMIIAGPFLVLVFVLMIGLFLPQLELMTRPKKWWLSASSACLAVLLLSIGLSTSSYSTLRPKLNSVSYGLNLDTKQAFWMSGDDAPDEWTAQFFPPGTSREPVSEFLQGHASPALKAPGPIAPLPGPNIRVVSDAVREGSRELVLRIESPARAATLDLRVTSDTEVFSAFVFGESVNGSKENWGLHFNLFPHDGAELTLRVDPARPLALNATERFYGMPDIPGIRPRPDYMAPEPNTVHRGRKLRDGQIWVTRTFTFPGADTPKSAP